MQEPQSKHRGKREVHEKSAGTLVGSNPTKGNDVLCRNCTASLVTRRCWQPAARARGGSIPAECKTMKGKELGRTTIRGHHTAHAPAHSTRDSHTKLHTFIHKAAVCFLPLVILSVTIVPVGSQNTVVESPKIVSLVADDPDDLDGVYANLDTITITFDKNTDRAGLVQGITQTRDVVDALFSFSQSLGSNYRGLWQTPRIFIVTTLDWPGSAPPRIGPEGLVVTPVTNKGRSIRADPFTVGLSTQSISPSPRLSGDFGPQLIKIDRITAANPSQQGDEYSNGDTITIDLNMDTNEGFTSLGVGLTWGSVVAGGSKQLSKSQLLNLFFFSHSLGANFEGVWVTSKQIRITVLDATGAGPPPILVFTIQVKESGELRNNPPACAPSTAISPVLQGEWGVCRIEILEIKAEDPALPPNINRDFSVNDTITVTFNKATNQANLPARRLSKAEVDSVFAFSQSLGEDYIGQWLSRSLFRITSRQPAGATPQIGLFTLSVKKSAGLRNFPPQSSVCEISSSYLIGNWGTIIPRITDFYAVGDGGSDGDMDNGDKLYIEFFPATNRFRMNLPGYSPVATRVQINSVLNFSLPIGSDYTGTWLTDNLFEVTIRNSAGSLEFQRGQLFVTCLDTAVAPIRNIDGISGGCFSRSPNPIRGDFGQSVMTFSLRAQGDLVGTVTPGDQIWVNFSEPTDQALNGAFNGSTYGKKEIVDSLFTFSQKVGLNYEGRWTSRSTLLITILTVDPSEYPTIDSLTATVKFSANLRNFPPNSAPVTATSSALKGDFGPNYISISALEALDPTQSTPSYASGDRIRIRFSNDTNRAGMGTDIIPKASIDNIFIFSTSIGRLYEGRWVTRQLFEIAIIDATGATPPLPDIFTLKLLASAELRNFPRTSSSAELSSPILSGDFGPSPIRILSIVAADSLDLDDVFGIGDTLTITFSEATNKAQLPDVLTKAHIDLVLSFSQSLGADYSGEWKTNSVLVITARDVTGAGPPTIGGTRATVRAQAKLRNLPPVCAPTVTTSPPITGNWGILYPRIISVEADDPTDRNSVYSFLDTITIKFSIATNRAGRNNGDRLSRSQVLQQFLFSESLGNSFSGEWVNAQTLRLTVEGVAGATPPTIGGLFLTCRTDTGTIIRNELGTSRSCSEQSPRMIGDFGPSPITINVVLASDPTGLGSRYRAGNAISVSFSEDTNMGGFIQDQTLSRATLNNLLSFSASIGADYNGRWTSRKQLVIIIIDEIGAGPPIPGAFTVSVKASGNLRNFPPACAPTVVNSPKMIGTFGKSTVAIDSWVAKQPDGSDVCRGYVTGVTMTITFSEITNRALLYQSSKITRMQVDALFVFRYNMGQNYFGEWVDDQTLVLTITDPFGATPPEVGFVIGQVRASANLRGIPPVTSATEAIAPPMKGAFGPPTVRVISFEARDPDDADDIFSNGDEIKIDFNIPTNKADLPDDKITRTQLEKVFLFSMSLGLDFVGRWVTSSSLRISILNSTKDPSRQLSPHPPEVGSTGLTFTMLESGNLRNTPALCGASTDTSGVVTGNFGRSRITIVSMFASSLGGDSVYGGSDQISVKFSENTNMGGFSVGQFLNQFQVRQIFNFSQEPGLAITGQWSSRSIFNINIDANLGAAPPEIGSLRLRLLETGNIRNSPAQSSVTFGVESPTLEGSFGPSAMRIIAFTAHDPENSANVYHAGVILAILLSERPTWKKRPVYDGLQISMVELIDMFEFSSGLGQNHTGQWMVKDACPWKIYSEAKFFDGPPCFGVLIEILDVTGNGGPEIGKLTVKFLVSGDVRNSPTQSAPTTAASSPITGDWGITIPRVQEFFAQDGGNDQGYGNGDQIFLQFSELTDRAGIKTTQMTKDVLDKLLYFDQKLGKDYTGEWLSANLIKIKILDATDASPPEIGTLTVTIRPDAGYELKNADSTSYAAETRYTYNPTKTDFGLTGSFGTVLIKLLEIEAFSAQPPLDDRWGPGDIITIEFNQVVNKGCYQGCPDFGLKNEYITSMLVFTDSLWSPNLPVMGTLTGRWLSDGAEQCSSCKSGTAGFCKKDAVRDVKSRTELYLDVTNRPCVGLQNNSCPSGYSLCNSKILQIINNQGAATQTPPTIGGLKISLRASGKVRNYPASINVPSGTITESLTLNGSFGPPCVRINTIVAHDPIGYNGDFSIGDTITINFNQPTNMAGEGINLNKDQLLNLIAFYCKGGEACPNFANDYEGTWTSRQELRITVTDVSNAYPNNATADPMHVPLPGDFYLKFKAGVYLINYPPACLPFSPTSSTLNGSFGPSNIAINRLEADDPANVDKIWDVGDTLLITFSRDTDYAGRGPGPWNKAAIDQVFMPSCPAILSNCVPIPFGQDYTGRWLDRKNFQITILKPNTNKTGLDGDVCCSGNFEVRILASGNLRHFPPTSSPASTCGGPNACPQVGFPTSDYWGIPGCTASGLDLSDLCEKLIGDYGTPFPRFQSLIGEGPPIAVSKYVAGSTITMNLTEYSNMGACRSKDIEELKNVKKTVCSENIGTCSLIIPWIAPDDTTTLKIECDRDQGTFVDKKAEGSYHNCQLIQYNNKFACQSHVSVSSAFAFWTTGLAPHQSCSGENPALNFEACLAANKKWLIHETIIPQANILLAMDFSDSVGISFDGRWSEFGPIEPGVCLVPCARRFQITIHDPTNSGPPEIDLFKIKFNPTKGVAIRRSFDFSPGSDQISDGMQGDFGPATVSMISVRAGANPTPWRRNSRGPLTGLYEEGCTITVGFDQYTNRGNFSLTDVPKEIIDKMFVFSRVLGSDYTGHWANCTKLPGKTLPGCQSFVITIRNAGGASPPTVFGLQTTLLETGNIRNYPSAAARSLGSVPIMLGHFGPSSVYVERLVASDPGNFHSRFDVGDRVSLFFNMPTNRADMELNRQYSKSAVDQLLQFSWELATDYTGSWIDNSTFQIDITEVNPLQYPLPFIGQFKLQLLGSGNLRNYPPTCDQSNTTSSLLSGGFGRSTLFMLSAVASDPSPQDTVYSDGDKITITFSQSTNKAGLPDTILTKEQLNNLFHFSMQLGDNYTGSWLNDRVFEIIIVNSTKPSTIFWCEPKPGCTYSRCSRCALQMEWHSCVRQLSDSSLPDAITNLGTSRCPDCPNPLILKSRLANDGTADCPSCPDPIFQWMKTGICEYKSDGGYQPPLLDLTLITVKKSADLREVPPILNPTTGIDETNNYPPAYLSGGFGYSSLEILSLVADDPDKADSVYSNQDTITVTFSEPTNRANMPEAGATKADIDRLFDFSHNLGLDYTGHWPDRLTLVITIVNKHDNSQPTVGGLYVTTKEEGKLRNYPASTNAALISGNRNSTILKLAGDFGPSTIYIRAFRASSPESLSDVYNVGAAFTIYFSELTNRGDLPKNGWTKAQIDNAFDFYSDIYDQHPLGLDYSGNWPDNQTFMISILGVDRNEPKGPPPLTGGNFRVSIKAEGNIRNVPPQCSATVINRVTNAQKGLGGDSNLGINCDCCSPCGTCDVCDAYSCGNVMQENGQMQAQCTKCCGLRQHSHCCRILSGNYGKIVSVYEIKPVRMAVTGQFITIVGHGFDGRAQYNMARVGGFNCPIFKSIMDEKTKDGYMICLAPDGIGSDIKAVEVEVFDFFTDPPVSYKGLCCKLLDEQGFVILPRDMIGHGGVLYLPPVVTAISPLTLTYQKGGIITVLGTNFGTKTLFDDNGKYVGPLGRSTPVEEYMPPSVFVVKEGGAHVECERTVHVSSTMLICETPEMTSMNVSIVSNVVGQRSQAWAPGTVLTIESLPRYKYDCPVEKSGRCYDCCEAECQFQFETGQGIDDPTLIIEGFQRFCKTECFKFCGYDFQH